jgi:hypothetical protein
VCIYIYICICIYIHIFIYRWKERNQIHFSFSTWEHSLEDCCKEDSSNRIDNIENYSEIDEIEIKGTGDTVSGGAFVGGIENECIPVVSDRYIYPLILIYINFYVYCIYACESEYIYTVLIYSLNLFFIYLGVGKYVVGRIPTLKRLLKLDLMLLML